MKHINKKGLIAIMMAGYTLVSLTGCTKTSDIETKSSYEQTFTEEDVVNHYKVFNEYSEDVMKDKKVEAIEIVSEGIDFVFFGGKSLGLTAEDVTTECTDKVTEIIGEIDAKMETVPGYEDGMEAIYGNKYGTIKRGFKNGFVIIEDEPPFDVCVPEEGKKKLFK